MSIMENERLFDALFIIVGLLAVIFRKYLAREVADSYRMWGIKISEGYVKLSEYFIFFTGVFFILFRLLHIFERGQ